jgi:hypothetical protein
MDSRRRSKAPLSPAHFGMASFFIAPAPVGLSVDACHTLSRCRPNSLPSLLFQRMAEMPDEDPRNEAGWQLARRGIHLALNNRVEEAEKLLRSSADKSGCPQAQAGYCFLAFMVSLHVTCVTNVKLHHGLGFPQNARFGHLFMVSVLQMSHALCHICKSQV